MRRRSAGRCDCAGAVALTISGVSQRCRRGTRGKGKVHRREVMSLFVVEIDAGTI